MVSFGVPFPLVRGKGRDGGIPMGVYAKCSEKDTLGKYREMLNDPPSIGMPDLRRYDHSKAPDPAVAKWENRCPADSRCREQRRVIGTKGC